MFNTIVGARAVGARAVGARAAGAVGAGGRAVGAGGGATSRYSSSSGQKMRILAAPATALQHW
jgi:hypothetical protein